jgi:hypothetical protein
VWAGRPRQGAGVRRPRPPAASPPHSRTRRLSRRAHAHPVSTRLVSFTHTHTHTHTHTRTHTLAHRYRHLHRGTATALRTPLSFSLSLRALPTLRVPRTHVEAGVAKRLVVGAVVLLHRAQQRARPLRPLVPHADQELVLIVVFQAVSALPSYCVKVPGVIFCHPYCGDL